MPKRSGETIGPVPLETYPLDPVTIRTADQLTAALLVVLGGVVALAFGAMAISAGRLDDPRGVGLAAGGLGIAAVALGLWCWRRVGTRAGRIVLRVVQAAVLLFVLVVEPGADYLVRGRWIDALHLLLGLAVLATYAFLYARSRARGGAQPVPTPESETAAADESDGSQRAIPDP